MEKEFESAGLVRRLAAILYDSLLIIAIWLITTLLLVALINEGSPLQGPLFQLGLYVEACLFYSYFWRLRGQTLGMQVWKIKLVNPDLQTLSWQECFSRLFFALLSKLNRSESFMSWCKNSRKRWWCWKFKPNASTHHSKFPICENSSKYNI